MLITYCKKEKLYVIKAYYIMLSFKWQFTAINYQQPIIHRAKLFPKNSPKYFPQIFSLTNSRPDTYFSD